MKLKTVIIVEPRTDTSHLSAEALAFYDDHVKLRQHWTWFLVDSHLYVLEGGESDDGDPELLKPWEHMDGEASDKPYVRLNGEYLFEVRHARSYETSAVSPIDGKSFVVHDG